VAAPGTYHLTWDSGGNEGAQLWLVAVQSSPPPSLRLRLAGEQLVITWPTPIGTYILETTTNLSASNSWMPVTNTPTLVDFQITVTNAISHPSQYYRLRKQ
jgi:hypothetical protein